MKQRQIHTSLFTKITLPIIVFLFGIILLLCWYLFSDHTNTSQNQIKEKGVVFTIISSKNPLTVTNDTPTWKSRPVNSGKVKVLSPLKIAATLSITFANSAPSSSSAGIAFSNGLLEKDNNLRKISLYYYLKQKEWLLSYYEGKKVSYYGIASMPQDHIQGTFSFSINSEGKSIVITSPDKRSKIISLPSSLYSVTNEMQLYVLSGPESTATVSSISYEMVK